MNEAPFVFSSYNFDPSTAVLRMVYRYGAGPEFVETIRFPVLQRTPTAAELQALDQTFRLLFLLAGVSYYKAYVPQVLRCEAFDLDNATASFVEKTYRLGLGEFAYTNKLDLSQIHIERTATPAPAAVALDLVAHFCIPVGGGKDSIVTFEALRRSPVPITLFALGSASGVAPPITATIAASRLPAVIAERHLSPVINDLNAKGALNGHIPVTAILSVIALATCLMQGFDSVVMANEHSASAPNLIYQGVAVNHQYSKSFEFEEDLARYVTQHISPNLKYFSFLRPLTETAIVERFARLTMYHSVFHSCNKAFRQDGQLRQKNWCCDCPKCRFIFLAMAPFLPKDDLVAIFGKNMLNDPTQEQGFAELCGLAANKPFECVGEIEESALLMEKLYQAAAWRDDCVVEKLGARTATRAADFDWSFDQLFTVREDHNLPPEYVKFLDASH